MTTERDRPWLPSHEQSRSSASANICTKFISSCRTISATDSGKAPRLLPSDGGQRRDRGHREGTAAASARDATGTGKTVHGLSDHLAPVEDGPQKADACFSPIATSSSIRRWSTTSGHSERRWPSSAPEARSSSGRTAVCRPATGARQQTQDRYVLRDLPGALSGDYRSRGPPEDLP